MLSKGRTNTTTTHNKTYSSSSWSVRTYTTDRASAVDSMLNDIFDKNANLIDTSRPPKREKKSSSMANPIDLFGDRDQAESRIGARRDGGSRNSFDRRDRDRDFGGRRRDGDDFGGRRGGDRGGDRDFGGRRRDFDREGGDRRGGDRRGDDWGSRLAAPEWGDVSKLPQVVKNIYTQPHPDVVAQPAPEIAAWRHQHDMSIFGRDCPNPILKFEHTPYPEFVKRELNRVFAAPTIIQSQGWPVAMSGRDMVGSATTGSGKTLSFILPALEHIAAQQTAMGAEASQRGAQRFGDVRSDPIVVILAPTRELAVQIHEEAERYARGYNIRMACLFGGQGNRGQQARQLRDRPQLIVACPGRLLDFVSEGLTTLRRVSFWVLDEADRMLDMGFEPQIRAVSEQIRPDRQVLMWSATWPKKIQSLANEFLNDPIRIRIGQEELAVNKNVEQRFELCDPYDRFHRILNIIRDQPPDSKILIFSSTKTSTEWLSDQLYNSGIPAVVLHGDKAQAARTRALEQFKSANVPILIATDVAARGLHVNDINMVINYEFPPDFENYIHRIGRTGRAGKTGVAVSFLTPRDYGHVQDIISVIKDAGQAVPEEIRDVLRSKERERDNRRGGGRPSGRKFGGFANFGANRDGRDGGRDGYRRSGGGGGRSNNRRSDFDEFDD